MCTKLVNIIILHYTISCHTHPIMAPQIPIRGWKALSSGEVLHTFKKNQQHYINKWNKIVHIASNISSIHNQ